ncbi:MAG: YfcC family protein [Gemmatimonadales bacterium]|nr:YfcC family protein [Gemmatimonadales bacterium]
MAGTYQPVEAQPVGPLEAMVAIPRGMADAASIIFFVFLVGAGFTVVERTGALGQLVNWLAGRLSGRGLLVIPIVGLAFGAGGVFIQMQEELIAFVPVLLLLTRRLGFNPLTAVAMSLGASAIGASFSFINPFQVGIAQKVAGLELLSGQGFRIAFLLPAWAIWIAGTMLFARRTRVPPAPVPVDAPGQAQAGWRHAAVLLVVVGAFAVFIVGVLKYGWDFDQLAAVFFVMGAVAGLVGGLRLAGTAEGFVEGFRGIAFAALLIGFARAIYVVLDHGRVVDTMVQGLFAPVAQLPTTVAAWGMMAGHAIVHVPVPSTSGQAVLTLPLLVPLSDLIGLSRQVTVLAYQYGAGLCEILTPTNGALMAMLAASGVRYEEWLRFALPLSGILFALGAVAVAVGVAVGL